MSKQLTKFTVLALVFILMGGFNGCNTPADETGNLSGDETGILSVFLTDTPFPTDLVAEANVTIVKLEARAAGGNADSSFITLSEDTVKYNLLDLRNGVTASLAELVVPVGSYDLVRLYTSEGSVVMNDSTVYDLKVPSGALKLFVSPAIDVVSGLTSDLLLDFDVEKSFVAKGGRNNLTGFNFKPVIRAINVSTVGRISGTVTDTAAVANALDNATVWVVEQDTVLSTTYTGADGAYTILGLPAGSYSAYATLAGYDTVTVNVDVATGSQSIADFELTLQ